MKQIELRDTLEFRRGRAFEQSFARQLLQRGHHVVRCYDLDVDGRHKAPVAEGRFNGLRLPDIQVLLADAAELHWVECKEKTAASYTYLERREEHGISLPCFRDYYTIEEKSGRPVWLSLAEWTTGVIFLQRLRSLGPPREYRGQKMGLGGMAFWPRDAFRPWGRINKGDGQFELPFGRRTFS